MSKGSKRRPWSALQRDLYGLFSPDIDIQFHAAAYRMNSQRGHTDLPRYWITLGKEIIWDYPKDFKNKPTEDAHDLFENGYVHGLLLKDMYPHGGENPTVSDVIREYIETPGAELLTKSFQNDKWGLTDILRSADRRIGKRRLKDLRLLGSAAVDKIIDARLRGEEEK
jgi:hypothetical protein